MTSISEKIINLIAEGKKKEARAVATSYIIYSKTKNNQPKKTTQ